MQRFVQSAALIGALVVFGALPNTNAWNNWSFVSVNANLQQGSNSITVFYNSSSGSMNLLNLDNLQVLY